jgi:rod shape determining protein RodA
MTGTRVWRHFDYVLLAATILLAVYGVVMIYSATYGSLDPRLQPLWRRQAIFAAIGVGVIILLAAFPRDYQWLGDFWWLAYLIAAALLVLVLFFGQSEIGDVRSWFRLGSFNLQPSFLAMLLLTIAVGATLSRRRHRRGSTANPPLFGAPKTSLVETTAERPDFVSYLVSAGMALSLAMLVFRQPDMATAAVLVAMWLAMLFESDAPARYLVLTVLVGVGSLYPIWKLIEVLGFGYMHERVLGFLNPGASDTSYQLRQAFIAIGSGGMWGQGLGHGTQSQLRYLPVRHTDFIFAVTAEEMGFVGVLLLFTLYLILFWRLLRIIMIAPDGFGRLLATGVLAMILFQIFVNVGMNLGLLPIAGLPLPFMSYGPAALLTTMAGIGLAENVVMRHKRLEF